MKRHAIKTYVLIALSCHAKAVFCPKLKARGNSHDTKKDRKTSRQVHIVQWLPLNFKEFSKVVMSHMSETHECCVTQAMWQTTQLGTSIWYDSGL